MAGLAAPAASLKGFIVGHCCAFSCHRDHACLAQFGRRRQSVSSLCLWPSRTVVDQHRLELAACKNKSGEQEAIATLQNSFWTDLPWLIFSMSSCPPDDEPCCALCQMRVIPACTSPASDVPWRWPCNCGVQLHVGCAVQVRLRSEKAPVPALSRALARSCR